MPGAGAFEDEAEEVTPTPRPLPGLPPSVAPVRLPTRSTLPGKPTPPLDLPLPLLVLTEQARRVPEAERPELALRLNTLLGQMAAEGGDRKVADTFHRLLESGKLEGLVDSRGRTCRAAAVEALLALGFPYALEVRPEDLEHLRANKPKDAGRQGFTLGPAVPAALVGSSLVAQALLELSNPGPPESLVTAQVGLSVLALMALWLAPPKSAVYRVGLGLLALVTCLGVVGPLVEAGVLGLWAVFSGLVAVLLAALRES
ncbi:hypothetical protein ACLESD_26970 [Pyxidicoccus sp. 3LFB2]